MSIKLAQGGEASHPALSLSIISFLVSLFPSVLLCVCLCNKDREEKEASVTSRQGLFHCGHDSERSRAGGPILYEYGDCPQLLVLRME